MTAYGLVAAAMVVTMAAGKLESGRGFIECFKSSDAMTGRSPFWMGALASWTGLALMGVATSAAAADRLLERDLLGPSLELGIVSHFPQTALRAPASTTVITGDMLRASGAMNWVDVFRLVPGFQAYSPNANRFGIDYHGQGRELPNHLEVMIDGRSVYDPVQSTVLWGTLGVDLDDIERIEIVRGPNASAQGSNAFRGAVNIITKAPLGYDDTRARMTVGERGTRQVSLGKDGRAGDLAYRLALGFDHNDGFPDFNEFGPDDGAETWNINLRTRFTPTLTDTFSLDGGFVRQDTEFGDADRLEEYIPVRYYSQYQRLGWERQLDAGNDFQATFYRNYLRANGTRDFGLISELVGIPSPLVETFFGFPDQNFVNGFHTLESERLDLEMLRRSRSSSLSWALGAGARREAIKSRLLTSDNETHDENMFRLFGHGEWSLLPLWSLASGVMVEKTPVGTLVSPRLSLGYEFAPEQMLRLTGARGRRAPSISEMEERQVALLDSAIVDDVRRTADLDDERIDSLELSYVARFPRLGVDVDAKLFREWVRQGLDDYREVIDPVPPFFDDERLVRDNVARWNTQGFELQMLHHWSERTWVRVHYAYQDIDSRRINRFEPVLDIRDFDNGAPRHSGGLLFNHHWTPQLDGGFFVYAQSRVDWRNGEDLGQFTRIDAQVTWRFHLGASLGQLQLVAQNLGSDYSEFNRENQFQTAFFLRAKLDLMN